MIWAILITIAVVIFFRFFTEMDKDKSELRNQPLEEKFALIVYAINDAAFGGLGKITKLNDRIFNLYEEGQNQIINFQYSTGSLTITWRYKYFQKEIMYEKQFDGVRNLSIFDQQRIAEFVITQMSQVVAEHKKNVLGL